MVAIRIFPDVDAAATRSPEAATSAMGVPRSTVQSTGVPQAPVAQLPAATRPSVVPTRPDSKPHQAAASGLGG